MHEIRSRKEFDLDVNDAAISVLFRRRFVVGSFEVKHHNNDDITRCVMYYISNYSLSPRGELNNPGGY